VDPGTDNDKIQSLVLAVEMVNRRVAELAARGYRVDIDMANAQTYAMAYRLNLIKVEVFRPVVSVQNGRV